MTSAEAAGDALAATLDGDFPAACRAQRLLQLGDRADLPPVDLADDVALAEARAGFSQGDIVREINGRQIGSVAELQQALSAASRWEVTIERRGQRITGRFG